MPPFSLKKDSALCNQLYVVCLGIIEFIEPLQVCLNPNPVNKVWIPKQTRKIA